MLACSPAATGAVARSPRRRPPGSVPVRTIPAFLKGAANDHSQGHFPRHHLHRAGLRLQVGLHHRHRLRPGPQGAQRGRRSSHFGQEGRARVAAGVAAQGLPPLGAPPVPGARLGQHPPRPHRLPGHLLLRRAAVQGCRPQEPRRGRPRGAGSLREAGHPASGAGAAGWRGRRRSARQRVGCHHLSGHPGEGGRHLLLHE